MSSPSEVTSVGTSDVDPELVKIVRQAWGRALDTDVSSIDPEASDFFAIGGYSLLALQVISDLIEASDGSAQDRSFEIEGRLLGDLFERPFVVNQARILAEEEVTFDSAHQSG